MELKTKPESQPQPIIWLRLLFFLAFAAALGACVPLSDPESSQEFQSHLVGAARPDQSVGQSFVSRRPRAHSLILWLHPQPGYPLDSALFVSVYTQPTDSQPLHSFTYPFNQITDSITVPLHGLGAHAEQPNAGFYVEMRTNAGGVDVLGRSEEAYPLGQAYVGGQPQPSDLAFRLKYDYDLRALLSDLGQWASQAWLLLPLVLVCFLPGWLLLSAARLQSIFEPLERLGLSLGLSLAVLPLVLLWTSTLGLHWSQKGLFLAAGLLLVLFILRLVFSRKRSADQDSIPDPQHTSGWSATLVLLAIVTVAFGVRLIMVRDLVTPAWVDPVHHGVITRLILEQGAYPQSYTPYFEMTDASYHAGFHASLAAFLGLSGMDIAPGMLLFGQFLNACAVLAVYLFTTTLTKSRLAGLLAALFTAFFTPMPAYYASWGRYTQLAGLLILPAALALLLRLLEHPPAHWKTFRLRAAPRLMVLAAVACGGLFLVHYRVLAFLVALIVAWLVVHAISEIRTPGLAIRIASRLALLFAAAGLAILLSLPWWPAAISGLILPTVTRVHVLQAPFKDFSWSYLDTALGTYILVLGGLGALLAMILRRRFAWVLLLWIVLLFGLANLAVISPYLASLVNNTSVAILLFMPSSALAGYLIAYVLTSWRSLVPSGWRLAYDTGAVLGILALSLLAMRSLLPILNPGTVLSRQADLPALAWAEQNLPPGSQVLINPFLWGYGLYAGADGGAWLAPAAGLPTLPPPVLYGATYDTDYAIRIRSLNQQVYDQRNDPAALAETLRQNGVTHVFIGARAGELSPRLLSASPDFEIVYAQRGVNIYSVVP